jgi:hypothetical protein
MEVYSGELTCAAGAMGLSQSLERSLAARFAGDRDPDDPFPHGFVIGGRWFCPADGTPMEEVAGVVACPRCSRSLTRSQIFQLVELHPHRQV